MTISLSHLFGETVGSYLDGKTLVSVSNDGTKIVYLTCLSDGIISFEIKSINYSTDHFASIPGANHTYLPQIGTINTSLIDSDVDYLQVSDDGTSVMLQLTSRSGDTNGSLSQIIHFKYSDISSAWLPYMSANRTFIDTIDNIEDILTLNGRLSSHSADEPVAKVFMNGSGTKALTFTDTTPPKIIVFNIDPEIGSLSFAVSSGDPRISLTGSLGSFRQMRPDPELNYFCYGSSSGLEIKKINSDGTLSFGSFATYTGIFRTIISLSDLYILVLTSHGFYRYIIDRTSTDADPELTLDELVSPYSFSGENYGSYATRDGYIISFKETQDDVPKLLIYDDSYSNYITLDTFPVNIRNILYIKNRNRIIVSSDMGSNSVEYAMFEISGTSDPEVTPFRNVVLVGSSDQLNKNLPKFVYHDNHTVTMSIIEPIGIDIIPQNGTDGLTVPVYIRGSGGYYRNVKYTLTGDITGLNPEEYSLEAFIVNLPQVGLTGSDPIEIPLIRPTDPGYDMAPALIFTDLPNGITYESSNRTISINPEKFDTETVDLKWSSYIGGRTINDVFKLDMVRKNVVSTGLSTNAKIVIGVSVGVISIVIIVIIMYFLMM